MRTDCDRWAELLRAAGVARVRTKRLADAMSELGIDAVLAHHIDVALRRLPHGPNGHEPPIEPVKAIARHVAELVKIAAAAGVEPAVVREAVEARRVLVRAADAFLVDTQVL